MHWAGSNKIICNNNGFAVEQCVHVTDLKEVTFICFKAGEIDSQWLMLPTWTDVTV